MFGLGEYHWCCKASKNFLAFQLPNFEEYIRANVQISASRQIISQLNVSKRMLEIPHISARRSLITFAFLAYLQSIFSSGISAKDCHIGGKTGIVN